MIPQRLRINGRTWRVVRHSEPGLDGSCDHRTRTIRLCTTLRGRALHETFLHEVLHACYPAKSMRFTLKQEEALICALSPILLPVLRAQGWLK